MSILIGISFVSALLYLAVSLYLSSGLRELRKPDLVVVAKSAKPTISVIVAARNEEQNLPNLLNSLKLQSYPTELFDITIVDDRSDDNTSLVVESFQKVMENLHVMNIDTITSGVSPKKNAISQGIVQTSGEVIVITDADCIVPPRWIEEIALRFSNPSIGLVQGLTMYPKYDGISLFQRFQRLDFFSHSVVAAAGIGRGLPINSNANNFSYRRELFESLRGFAGCEHIVSGDDDLLLQKVWESGKYAISYLNTIDASVRTTPEKTFHGFFEQRKRWGSKTVFYKPKQVVVLSLIFIFYLIVAINTLICIFSIEHAFVAMGLYVIKIFGELLFLLPGTSLFEAKEMRKDIVWASPLQLWLVLCSVFAGVLGSFTWKGTSYRKTVKKS